MISLPSAYLHSSSSLSPPRVTSSYPNYMNMHSVIIVFGGSLAVLFIGTAVPIIKALWHNCMAMFKARPSVSTVRDELLKLAANRAAISDSKDPMIKYALSLWERGVDSNTFQALLSQYRDQIENEDHEAIAALHNLNKYPPALGMMGTVMGMISLFSHLGESDKSALGPSLATAMTATFYGLLASNALLSPLADRMTLEAMHRKKYLNAVYEMITLINRREPINLIEEELTNREAA